MWAFPILFVVVSFTHFPNSSRTKREKEKVNTPRPPSEYKESEQFSVWRLLPRRCCLSPRVDATFRPVSLPCHFILKPPLSLHPIPISVSAPSALLILPSSQLCTTKSSRPRRRVEPAGLDANAARCTFSSTFIKLHHHKHNTHHHRPSAVHPLHSLTAAAATAAMNEDLSERWRGPRRGNQPVRMQAEVVFLPPKLNTKVREYYEAPPAVGGDWLSRSEVPGPAEIMDREDTSNSSSDVVELPPNRPLGPFASKEEYLHTHYELLREDSLRPLREAVTAVRETPAAHEEGHNGKIGIYEKASLLPTHFSASLTAVGARLRYLRVNKRHRFSHHIQSAPHWETDHLGAIKTPHHWQPGRSHACGRYVPAQSHRRRRCSTPSCWA